MAESAPAPSKSIFDYFTRDRARTEARFHTMISQYQMAKSAPQVVPTDEDMADFAREYPVASDQASRLRSVGRASGAGGLVGALAMGAHSWKHNRMIAYLAVGGALGGATAALVADDIASWVYGTYTFDPIATKQAFYNFMRERYPDAPTLSSQTSS